MTRTEAVERAEAWFGRAGAELDRTTGAGISPTVETRASIEVMVALGNGYLALARLADD